MAAYAGLGVDAAPGGSAGWRCADSAYQGQQYWTCRSGALHRCEGRVPQERACPAGCAGRPLGTDDVCN